MAHIGDGMAGAIGWGTLAASITFPLTLSVSAGGAIEWGEMAFILFLTLPTMFVAFFMVLLAAIVLGMPTVWLFRRIYCASSETIGLVGALAGASIFLVPELASGAPYDADLAAFALAGLVGGGVTGAVWGAAQDRKPAEGEISADHPNRLDDPRILR